MFLFSLSIFIYVCLRSVICNCGASSEFVSLSILSWQILTVHAQPSREARDLAFCLKVPVDSLLVCVSSGGSGETARMRRLAWTFAARIDDKYQIHLTWPNLTCTIVLVLTDIVQIIWAAAWQNQHQRTNGPVNAHLTPGPGIYFYAFIHVYSHRAGVANPFGTNVDVNRKPLSLCPFVASFKTISLKYDFKHILNDFIHVYSPRAGTDNPLVIIFWCQQKVLITLPICCQF